MSAFSDPVTEIDSQIAVLRMAQRAHQGDLAEAQGDAVAAMAHERSAQQELVAAEGRISCARKTIEDYAEEIDELFAEREAYVPRQRAVPSGE